MAPSKDLGDPDLGEERSDALSAAKISWRM